MTPREYLQKNSIKVKDAAIALKRSRPYISEIINGRPGGRRVAEDWQAWTGGLVTIAEVMCPNEANLHNHPDLVDASDT